MKARLRSPKVFLITLFIFTLVGCTKGVVPNFGILNSNNYYSWPFVDGGYFDGSPGYLLNSSKTPALASYNFQLYLVSAGGPSGGIQTYLYNGQDNQPNWDPYEPFSPQPTPGLATNPTLDVGNDGRLYGAWAEANTGGTYANITQIHMGYLSGVSWTSLGGPSSCGTTNCLNVAPGQNASTPAMVVVPSPTPTMGVFWAETAATGGGTNIQGARFANGNWTALGAPLNRNANSIAANPQAIYYGGQIYVAWSENGVAGAGPSVIHVDTSTDGNTYTIEDGGTTLPSLSQTGAENNATNPFLAEYNNNIYISWIGNYVGTSVVRVAMFSAGNWVAADGGSNSGLNYNPSANASGTPSMVVGSDNNLYIIWTEVYSNITQVHIKEYNGSTWNWVDGSGPTGLNFMTSVNAVAPSLTLFNGEIYSSWEEFESGDYARVRVLH
jgi:hypothetical protein